MAVNRQLQKGSPPKLLGDRAKILVMGLVLGAFLIFYFTPSSKNAGKNNRVLRPQPIDISAFTPDPKILAEIKDSTPLERGAGLKYSVWEHLMRRSYNIGAGVAKALNMPEAPASVAELRSQPQSFRGKYIWVKGRLEDFREEKMHPIPRARAFAGRLRTADGDQVLFRVSQPLPASIQASDEQWVRVEGFFVKIEDKHYVDQDDVLNAPLIIGPRVAKAFPDWKAVDKLDPQILGRVKNAVWQEDSQTWRDDEDFRTLLLDSQDVPLWHIGSYARNHFAKVKDTDLHLTDIYELTEQYQKFRSGEYKQGAPLRVRGSFVLARVFRANTNPAGIEYWTEVWLQIHRMGSKLVPIWVANNIDDSWRYGEPVDVDGFFFKNYGYRTVEGGDKHTPLFVAGGIQRFKMENDPIVLWMGIIFAVMVLVMSVMFFTMNRRAKRESEEYMKGIIDRRQRRRGPEATQATQAPLVDEAAGDPEA